MSPKPASRDAARDTRQLIPGWPRIPDVHDARPGRSEPRFAATVQAHYV